MPCRRTKQVSMLNLVPATVLAAVEDLRNLGAGLRAATAAAADQTTAIAAPGVDEVSQAINALFGTQAQEFQAVSAKATLFHDQFVKLLHGGVTQYAVTEVANSKQVLTNAANAAAQGLQSHPLIGTGQASTGAAATPLETVSYHLGPLEAYSQNNVFGTEIGLRLNTPLGSATLFAAGFQATATTSIPVSFFIPSYHVDSLSYFGNPLLYFTSYLAVNYGYNIYPTGYGLSLNGLTFTWPGPASSLGGVLPSVSYTPWPGPPLFL
ncbi:hypothetical protein BV508_15200 [Mycobacterium intermedium]|nr:hypothetical protein BV508_15200 [Mycobacterium intermedium]